ncbi:ATP-binding protein [Mycobacterium sp. MYCO198283]|uniref:ATP-binding protein n=1 Tax=Mycobacterium sp. MYCO198283 TaxID=2883505 RepID=UPI001E502247|nr:ATP-binding protein [Mycobacterium sp. MYCO198283]MCG5433974.1 ATP-binding protein [Mycobacterium sp. MYCO198283]
MGTFAHVGAVADAETAAGIRDDLSRWLQEQFDLDPVRHSDIVLAANEALANVAEFAYLSSDRPGTMDVQVRYEAPAQKLILAIADSGVWRIPERRPENRSRGRGIPLMRALSDRTAIETTPDGTRVCLEWHGVAPRSAT